MTSPKRKLISLRFSLASAFIGIVVATALALGATTYVSVQKYARNDIRERLHNAAALAALLIAPEDHAKVLTVDDENSAPYKKIKAALRQVRDRCPGVRYVYTFRQTSDGKVIFVVDAEDDPKEMSHVGDEYKDRTEALEKAFNAPYEVHVESEFASDKWGTWISSFSPVLRPNGTLEAVIGIDMSAKSVIDYERRYLTLILTVCGIVGVLIAGVGLWFARQMSRPLVALSNDMGRIRRLELDSDVDMTSGIAEVMSMEVALDNLKKGLKSFRRYVPAELVAELMQMQKEAKLGAERTNITIFFSDVADFTAISERLGVEALAFRLGQYFEIMTRTVMANKGAVDKFIGDAVMAFWGAPTPLKDHASMACKAALDCQRQLADLFMRWEKEGVPAMHTRIGLNTGDAVVGNIGYVDRLSYTALGDNVNLASRLEALNKYYETKILISEATLLQTDDAFETRLIDSVVVKGKTQGVRIYELAGERGTLTPALKTKLEQFNEGMDLYMARQWKKATSLFQDLKEMYPSDKPVRIILERCEKYAAEPPGDDWAGVIVLRDK